MKQAFSEAWSAFVTAHESGDAPEFEEVAMAMFTAGAKAAMLELSGRVENAQASIMNAIEDDLKEIEA